MESACFSAKSARLQARVLSSALTNATDAVAVHEKSKAHKAAATAVQEKAQKKLVCVGAHVHCRAQQPRPEKAQKLVQTRAHYKGTKREVELMDERLMLTAVMGEE